MFELEIHYAQKEKEDKQQISFIGGKLGLLRKILESLSEIVDHVELKVKEHGIEMQVMDSMHVVLVDVFLSRALFDKYRCDRDIILGIKIKSLITILKDLTFPANSLLHISCNDNPDKMSICYKQPQYTLNWDLSLYSFDNVVFEIPNIISTCEIVMSVQQFLVLPKLVGIFGEFLSIDASKDVVIFKQVGDTTSADMTLKKDGENEVEINVTEPIKREMAMKYINIISKVASMSSNVKIQMGEEIPIFIELNIFNLGHLRYFVAPKIDSDN